jgi:hypothetical protein
MMDNDTKKRIADYFDPWDLVEYLGLSTEEIVEAFEDDIDEKLNAIEELMGVTHEKVQG